MSINTGVSTLNFNLLKTTPLQSAPVVFHNRKKKSLTANENRKVHRSVLLTSVTKKHRIGDTNYYTPPNHPQLGEATASLFTPQKVKLHSTSHNINTTAGGAV